MSEDRRISLRISDKLFQYLKLSADTIGISLNALLNKILEAGTHLDIKLLEKVVVKKEKPVEHIKLAVSTGIYNQLEGISGKMGITLSDLLRKVFKLWIFIDKNQVYEAIMEVYRHSLEASLDYSVYLQDSKQEESFMEKFKKFEEETRGMSLEEKIQDMFKPDEEPVKRRFLRRDLPG